jgi:hypothetical protein
MSRIRMVLVVGIAAATACAVATGASASASPARSRAAAHSLSRVSGPAIGTPLQVRSGQAKLVGPANAGQHLRLTVGLRTPHPAAEDAFVASLKNKKSPNFRHFLSAAQWNARFAPSAKSYQAVVDWARSHGLTVTGRYADHLVVDLVGTVNTIQRALGIKINNYRLGSKAFYSNDRSVALPAGISGIVQSVAGLNSLQQLSPANSQFQTKHPAYVAGPVRQTGPSAHANGSKALLAKAMAASRKKLARNGSVAVPGLTNGFYDPTDIYSDQAYSVNALNAQGHCCNPTHAANVTPPATSIAISSVGTQNVSDMAGFQSQYPYLAYHFQEFGIDGSPACCDDEGTLDLEWSTAMGNSFGSFVDTAMVYMYDGANAQLGTFTDIWNDMLSDGHARTMSSSWGCAEAFCYDSGTMNTDHSIFNAMLGQGWTLMSASDDKGAFADCSHVSVEYPASDPDVLSAGGTDLFLSGGSWSNETAWVGGTAPGSCAANGGGGGGGCSVQWALPSYQNGRIQGLCSTRAEPDFSLNAGIGQNFFFNGGLHGVGGTSIVSPELAGIWAQINAYLGSFPSAACSGGCTTVGQANPDVYNALAGGEHDPYYDITSGCTTNDAGPGYCGITGYDRATGLGSADLFQLAMQVLWFNVTELSPPTTTITGPPTNTYVNSGTLSWSITDNPTDGTATGVQGYTAQWDSDPGNPITEPHGGSGNYFWDGPAAKNSASGSVSLASAGQGCHTLYVRAWDNIADSAVSTYGPVCYDGTAPVTTAGTSQFVQGAQINNVKVPVKITWSGADTGGSGLRNFTLWQSTDGGTYSQISSPTTTSQTVNLAPGHSYQFAINAIDNAGNVGTFVFDPKFKLQLAQETASQIKYGGTWTLANDPTAVGGKLKFTHVQNATAKYTFTGRAIAWIGARAANRGSAAVKLDNTAAVTINTHGTPPMVPRVMLYAHSMGAGSHTLLITNKATAGHPRIDVDAFAVLAPA